MRSVIENFESRFGQKLKKKNISRIDKWIEYLNGSEEHFKNFKEAGFSIEKVSSTVDVIFNRHSTDIHSIRLVEGLALKLGGQFASDEVKIIEILVQMSPWKEYLEVLKI